MRMMRIIEDYLKSAPVTTVVSMQNGILNFMLVYFRPILPQTARVTRRATKWFRAWILKTFIATSISKHHDTCVASNIAVYCKEKALESLNL